MAKLIVNAPTGMQEIVEVKEGGGYFDDALVVWDERKDGPLSRTDLAAVGGLARDASGKLVADSARQKQTDDTVKAEKDKAAKDLADKKSRRDLFKAIDQATTVDQLKAILRALIQELVRD